MNHYLVLDLYVLLNRDFNRKLINNLFGSWSLINLWFYYYAQHNGKKF